MSLHAISREAPVLIAGPTASGKSALAMQLAARDGRMVVNADALQVFANWRILTARPSSARQSASSGRRPVTRTSVPQGSSLSRPV